MSGDLIELVYLSAATRPLRVTELRELLGRSRRNNRAVDVTGLLLHADGSFLQVLEGRPAAVDELYERIARDVRHAHVLRVFRREITSRSSPSWRMGFAEPIEAMRTSLLWFTTVLSDGRGELPADVVDAVHSLVGQFVRGRWRQGTAPPASDTRLR